jgi:hypothetical protein
MFTTEVMVLLVASVESSDRGRRRRTGVGGHDTRIDDVDLSVEHNKKLGLGSP